MKNKPRMIFLGAGKMASAIAGGLVKNGVPVGTIAACDVSARAAESFHAATGCLAQVGLDERAIGAAEVVIVAVKPQQVAPALADKARLLKDKLLISIAAGIKLETLCALAGGRRVVRVMPNTPALIGQGMAAYACEDGLDAGDIAETERILHAVGDCCRVSEALMDAVTGLSGSGPAYVFDFIQALADGGVYAGLPRETALKLAAKTVAGAALMALETGLHPALLRDQVTSPGGTTSRGLALLEENAFRGIVARAVTAATARSAELGAKGK